MKRKSLKVLIILLLVLFISVMTIEAFASTSSSAIDAMKKMEDAELDTSGGNAKVSKILNAVLGLVQIAGTGISMIMVAVLGIKYMMAAPNDKADVKKQIAPLVIGAIILLLKWIEKDEDKTKHKIAIILCLATIIIMLPLSLTTESELLNNFASDVTVYLKNVFEFWA